MTWDSKDYWSKDSLSEHIGTVCILSSAEGFIVRTKELLRFSCLFQKKAIPLQATTKKVVTKKVVIWRIPLNLEQLWRLNTSQIE